MSRERMFDNEEVAGIRGLTSLTEPGPREDVGAVVDLAVIGARGDGKTQFIVHAIRTLNAYAPVLEGVEDEYKRDILQVVMDAREPRPEATQPGVVPHYVFRLRPESLLSQLGFGGRLGLLARAAGLGVLILFAIANAALLGAALMWLRGGIDVVGGVAAGGALLVGWGLALVFARRRFLALGEIEIVFWDVAGEHVYSASAADYYTFLSALVRERQRRAGGSRSYAFAPVLMCNPLSLGTRDEGSRYARLRQLIPLFASLGGRAPKAMVAINRWSVVDEICTPDTDRDEVIALVPSARAPEDELGGEAETADEEAGDDAAPAAPLPVVKRDVVRRHCLDAEDQGDVDVAFHYLRYDAGIQCEITARAWASYEELPGEIRRRWRAPTSTEPAQVLEYGYEEGPRSFSGGTRRDFLGFIAGMSYRDTRAPRRPTERAIERVGEVVRDEVDEGAETAAWPVAAPPATATAGSVSAPEGVAGLDAATRPADDISAWAPPGKRARMVSAAEGDWRGPVEDGADESDPWNDPGTAPGFGPASAGGDAHDEDAEPGEASGAGDDGDTARGKRAGDEPRDETATTQRGIGVYAPDEDDEPDFQSGGFRSRGT